MEEGGGIIFKKICALHDTVTYDTTISRRKPDSVPDQTSNQTQVSSMSYCTVTLNQTRGDVRKDQIQSVLAIGKYVIDHCTSLSSLVPP